MLCPGSQSSPGSTIPLPHCCKEITVRWPGVTRQEVFTVLCNVVHMFPMLQGEKFVVFLVATGDMRKFPLLLQLVLLCGQQVSDRSHPEAQS